MASGTVMSIGIVIMGAMIVVVVAFFIVKSTSKEGVGQTQKQPVENIETPVAPRKRRAPAFGLVLARLKFLSGLALRQLRRQTGNASPNQQPVDEVVAVNERFSIPLPDVTDLEPGMDAAPSSPDQGIPDVEPANEEESGVDMPDTIPAEESAESTQDQPQEELEPAEGEPEEMDEISDDEYQEQPKDKDAVLELFTGELAEESEVSKFAASLNNIDVHNLLEEAQDLINQLRGGRG